MCTVLMHALCILHNKTNFIGALKVCAMLRKCYNILTSVERFDIMENKKRAAHSRKVAALSIGTCHTIQVQYMHGIVCTLSVFYHHMSSTYNPVNIANNM